jgi:hypothetical protein
MSISPVRSSLQDQHVVVLKTLDYVQCKEAINLLQARLKLLENSGHAAYLDTSVTLLDLSNRAKKILTSAGLITVEDVLKFGLDNIWKLRGCGSLTAKEIKQVVVKNL